VKPSARPAWRRYARPGVLILITGVSLYTLLPSLLAVFASWRSLSHLTWYWTVFALISEGGSFAFLWQLNRIALHEDRWFVVACSQLSGNALGRIVPGGAATANAFAIGMLRRAGVEISLAAAGLAASTAM
jgi:chromate transport protein ChrA